MPLSRRFFCACLACLPAAPAAFAAGNATGPSPSALRRGPGLLEPSLHVEKGGKVPQVALTFDACSGAIDRRILDMLMTEGVPATIFVTGRWLRRNGEAIALIKSRPDLFAVENHGLNHVPAIDRPDLVYGIAAAGTSEAVASEVENGAAWVERAGFARPGWFRGATALYTPSSMAAIRAMGFRIAGFSLNGDQGASASARAAASRIGAARDGDVVISHINHPERPAGEGVAQGVLALKRKGFRFVHLDRVAPETPVTSPRPLTESVKSLKE